MGAIRDRTNPAGYLGSRICLRRLLSNIRSGTKESSIDQAQAMFNVNFYGVQSAFYRRAASKDSTSVPLTYCIKIYIS